MRKEKGGSNEPPMIDNKAEGLSAIRRMAKTPMASNRYSTAPISLR